MLRKLVPNSLFVRTALIVLFVLVISQAISISLFRFHAREPRAQFAAAGFISQLKTVRAALETLPQEKHSEFIQRLREERGFRVIPAGNEVLDIAPDLPALKATRERLRETIDPKAEIYLRPRADTKLPPNLVVKITVAGREYWTLFPRSRVIEQDFTYTWLGLAGAGILLALAAALLLMWRVNRPLESLAQSARDLGQGRATPPVTEIGPDEVKQVAVAFNQMRNDLATLDRERANFLAGVSHDLRTPLARLRLAVEMLPTDQATRADIERDIQDINSVIDQFMDFARDESVEPIETVDLNGVIDSVVDRAKRSGVAITASFATIPLLKLRPLAMKRLVANLIDNAAKYGNPSPERPILVSTSASNGQVCFAVEDAGPGVPPSQVERLMQPFTRLELARTGSSGAGLGLAIVSRIAKLHGGHFSLSPRPGGGTKAELRLASS